MTRLLVHVEGQTEESFVNEVLAPHLYALGFESVSARLVGHARHRDRRGGIRAWDAVRDDIVRHLKQDRGCLATTMVDYYRLPATGAAAWPGRADAGRLTFAHKAARVQDGMLADVVSPMGKDFDPARFIPYVVMHEFEGLLFSDCGQFAGGIYRPDLVPTLQAIRDAFHSPEEINDSPTTAPSKRIESLIPGYEKPLLGTLAALTVGLEAIRRECRFFREWLEHLETWLQRSGQ